MKRIFLIIFLLTTSAFCESNLLLENQEIDKAISQVSYEPNWFSMIFGLLIVLILIYLTGFLYQRLLKTNVLKEKNNDYLINILSTTSLGQGRSLHVVKIGEKNILIGSTQNNISYISDIEQKTIQEKNNDKNS